MLELGAADIRLAWSMFDYLPVRLIPFHAHFAQWEMHIFLQGRGSVRGPESTIAIEAGQSIIFSPGEPHQILNTGENELSYFVVD